jgi:two-component system, sensor histidine kinase and response regulator
MDPERPAGILIVDDTPANLELLAGMLKERGYRVRPVPSGQLALNAAHAEPPELILLDIRMPGMDGFEVCRRLKADPSLKDIPVLFISAATDIKDKMEAFTAGGLDYISKPFQVEEVHARVMTHLQLRRQQRALHVSYEKLTALEKMRDSLVHMLIHDLRSPLSVMAASLQLAQARDDLPEEARKQVEASLAAVKRMAVMVTAALDVSKMEAGALQVRLASFDLGALLAEVIEELRPLIGGRTLSLALGAVTVRADRELVARVVQNLLSNAIRFTPAAGQIRVAAEPREADARVEVADSGPGVPPSMREKIFEKFAQVEAIGQGRTLPSTGLGLTFCKLALDAQGGGIGVESAGEKGATFWFTLPRAH